MELSISKDSPRKKSARLFEEPKVDESASTQKPQSVNRKEQTKNLLKISKLANKFQSGYISTPYDKKEKDNNGQ